MRTKSIPTVSQYCQYLVLTICCNNDKLNLSSVVYLEGYHEAQKRTHVWKELHWAVCYDRDGNHAVIVDMRTIGSGSKCVVDILYDDGAKQTREKYHVSFGKFAKPGEFNVKAALSTDEWKPLYGFEDYYIVSRGGEFVRVKGVNRRRAKKTHIGSNGYERISLYRDGRVGRELAFVHRCIVQTFVRPINNDEEVNHIDGDRTNNALYNLEILPKKENNKKYIDMRSLGLTDDHLGRIREHCSSKAINLKEFLGRCVISYLEDMTQIATEP